MCWPAFNPHHPDSKQRCVPPCAQPWLCRWKAAGLDRLDIEPSSARLQRSAAPDGCVQVECSYRLRPGEQQAEDAATAAAEEGVGVGEVGLCLFVLYLICCCWNRWVAAASCGIKSRSQAWGAWRGS